MVHDRTCVELIMMPFYNGLTALDTQKKLNEISNTPK